MPPAPVDLLPALLIPAFVLLALAVFMPFTGGRETRRREAWARFDAVARIRGLTPGERNTLTRWAQLACAENPHYALVRRKDFDRFTRDEVARLRAYPPEAFDDGLEDMAALRRKLGFDRSPGLAQSSHDLVPGERLVLRRDDGERIGMMVAGIDEEGIHVDPESLDRRISVGWATFARDGEGHYRFRTRPLRAGLLSHGSFLVHEERRRDPRVPLAVDPFWVAVERLPDGAAPEDPEGVQVEVVDLSVGGLALLADRPVRRGSELWLDLPLGRLADSPKVRGIRAKVLGHGFREGGGPRPHFVNCIWIDLADAPRRVLDAFVWGRTSGANYRI